MLEVATFAPHKPYTPAQRYANALADLTYPRTPAYDTLPSDPPAWLRSRPPLGPAEQSLIDAAYRRQTIFSADRAVRSTRGRPSGPRGPQGQDGVARHDVLGRHRLHVAAGACAATRPTPRRRERSADPTSATSLNSAAVRTNRRMTSAGPRRHRRSVAGQPAPRCGTAPARRTGNRPSSMPNPRTCGVPERSRSTERAIRQPAGYEAVRTAEALLRAIRQRRAGVLRHPHRTQERRNLAAQVPRRPCARPWPRWRPRHDLGAVSGCGSGRRSGSGCDRVDGAVDALLADRARGAELLRPQAHPQLLDQPADVAHVVGRARGPGGSARTSSS